MENCLLSFGSVDPYNRNVAACFIERVLRSTAAAKMPVEQALKIKIAVKRSTSKAFGITIPQSILLKADEVIR
jgi:putative ABC transport system substrate-binding protein